MGAVALSLLAGSTRSVPAGAQTVVASAPSCASPADWSTPRPPTRIYGSTWYVGTQCIAAILVTSEDGHVLIDVGVPQAVPHVRASIERLGFRLADVKLILNSHAHYDHAGGIAELQRTSGATVAASPASAVVLEAGASGPDDPQYGVIEGFPAVASVRLLADSEVVRVGPLALTAHWTPGHTRGGTSWSWRSCEASRCLDIVYADSQTPVSADNFFYTRSTTYPNAIADFRGGHARLEAIRCDILLTPHPGASSLWQRMSANGIGPALVDPDGCRNYAARGRASLAARIAREAGAP